MSDLLPCPFCHSPAERNPDDHYTVACSGSWECPAAQYWWDPPEWNRRPSPDLVKAPAGLSEAVKAALYQPGMDGNTGKAMRRIAVLSDEVRRLLSQAPLVEEKERRACDAITFHAGPMVRDDSSYPLWRCGQCRREGDMKL